MKLLPCPFCGAEAYESDRFKRSNLTVWDIDHHYGCWFEDGHVIYPEGVEKWNRRHTTDKPIEKELK